MIRLFNEDCLKAIKKIPNESIDLVFADLPFYQEKQVEIDNPEYDGIRYKDKKIINYSIWNGKLVKEVNRVLKDGGNIVLVNAPRYVLSTIHLWLEYFNIRNTVPLIRKGSLRPAWMLGFQHNLMVMMVKGDKRKIWNGAKENHNKNYPTDVWMDIPYQNGFRGKGKDNWHPEAINLEVVERAVELNTVEGSVVLDVCMGSGTTGVACKKLNRHFMGIEINEKYFNIAWKRITGSNYGCNQIKKTEEAGAYQLQLNF